MSAVATLLSLGLQLPPPPKVGLLCVGLAGNNGATLVASHLARATISRARVSVHTTGSIPTLEPRSGCGATPIVDRSRHRATRAAV